MKSYKYSSLILIVIAMILVICSNSKVFAQPITRAQAEKRALNMINLKWNYSQAKNGTLSPESAKIVMQPLQLQGVTNKQMTGIPYNWGGFDSLDSKSDDAPWWSFVDAINKGAYAGNVNTDYNYGYIGGTAGIDCSGFIQATFNIKSQYKLSTRTMFDEYFVRIDLKNIKHMDILNKSAWHVAIFDRWGTYNGVYGAYTYESTPDRQYGGIEGTKKYFMSMAEINSGYEPGRFVDIVEGTTPSPQIYSTVSKGNFAKVINVNDWAYFRTEPFTSAPAVGTIPKGTVLYLDDYSAWWFKVTYQGKTGWIWSGVLGPIPSGIYAGLYDAYKLNIRMEPSLSGKIIGILNKYEYVEVLGHSDDKEWWKIRYNNVEGWVSSYYMRYVF